MTDSKKPRGADSLSSPGSPGTLPLLALPRFQKLPAEALPPPFQGLLAHPQDMTSTLTRFHGEELFLRVLEKIQSQDTLERRVALVGRTSGRPVEFGAISIALPRFSDAARQAVLDCQRPLGAILADFEIVYSSHPQDFFSLSSTPEMARALALDHHEQTLFGRRNLLLDSSGQCLAEVVEILPPEPA